MHSSRRTYLPAAGRDAAFPLYDPVTALLGAAARRQLLIDRADLSTAQRVLDVGCGTGSLAIAIKRAHPSLFVTGIDPDPLALARANGKAARAGVEIHFDRGFGDELPYAAASFERVFSSFMLHHLSPALQRKLLAEVLRVLSPGGRLLLTDFASSEHGRVFGQRLQGAERIEADLRALGFVAVQVEPRPRWLLQRVVYCSAERPT